jgi:hypothetical protein
MWKNGKWFVALTLVMMVGAVPIISYPPVGFYGIALAAALTGVPQWGYLRRHQVSALWLASTLAILPTIWGSTWAATLLAVPLFYSDPIRFNHPGQHFRPVWTWGWWTIGMGFAGGLLGAIQLPLLWTRCARAWCWPLVAGVAWACLGAAKTWPWQGRLPVSMVLGPVVWATVEWMGLSLLGKRLVGAPIGVAEQ